MGIWPLVALGFRFVLGVLFVAAGVAKLGQRRLFASAVRRYRVLPESVVGPVAAGLPWLELGVGGLLIGGIALPVVAVAAAGMLVVFAAGMALNLGRGRRIDCGCRGVGVPRRIGWPSVARNLVLAAAAAAVAAASPGPRLASTRPADLVSVGDAVAVLLISAVAVLAVGVTVEAARLWRASTAVLGDGKVGS